MVNLPAHGTVSDSQYSATSRPSRSLIGFGKGLIALAVLAFLLAACGASSSDGEEQMPSVASGIKADLSAGKDLATNFTFTLYQGEDELGGSELDLAQLLGKPVVLNFWAGLCPPCRAEMPDLQIFYDRFKDRATLIGIDLGQFTGLGSQENARELLQELGVTYPAGFTSESSVVKDFKVLGMPTTVFIRADGTIFEKWSGALNEDTLADKTNAMLVE
jgi:thiol-disulfide isomerase/thioredoxin